MTAQSGAFNLSSHEFTDITLGKSDSPAQGARDCTVEEGAAALALHRGQIGHTVLVNALQEVTGVRLNGILTEDDLAPALAGTTLAITDLKTQGAPSSYKVYNQEVEKARTSEEPAAQSA
jgi:hypothetical protein